MTPVGQIALISRARDRRRSRMEAKSSPVATTPCSAPAGLEQANLMQHVGTLRQQYCVCRITLGNMVSHEQLVVAVDTNYRKTLEGFFCDLRQSIAADNEELTRKMDELKSLLLQSIGGNLPGPTDPV